MFGFESIRSFVRGQSLRGSVRWRSSSVFDDRCKERPSQESHESTRQKSTPNRATQPKSTINQHAHTYTYLRKLPQFLPRRSQTKEPLGPLRLELGAFDGVAEGGSSGGEVAFFAEAARTLIAVEDVVGRIQLQGLGINAHTASV